MTDARNRKNANVVIIAAKQNELDYLFKKSEFKNFKSPYSPIEHNPFERRVSMGQLVHTNQQITIAIAWAAEMGLTDAAILATTALLEFNPQLLVMLGVCAGINEDVNLGDIIIPKLSYLYEYGKVIEEKIENGAENEQNISKLLNRLMTTKSSSNYLNEITTFLTQDYGKELNNIRQAAKENRFKIEKDLKVYTHPIATADLIVNSDFKRAEAAKADEKTIALDMESYSVLRTAEIFKKEAIVIKSVSDYASNREQILDKDYAKFTATEAFYRSLLHLIENNFFLTKRV